MQHALKETTFREIDAAESVDGARCREVCGVCLEDMRDGDLVLDLPCKHWFHKSCLESWLGTKQSCPMDRQRLPALASLTSNWVRMKQFTTREEAVEAYDSRDVDLVSSQTGLDAESAVDLLRRNFGDVVNALFDFFFEQT